MLLSSCAASESSSVSEESSAADTTSASDSSESKTAESQAENESSAEEMSEEPIDEPIEGEIAEQLGLTEEQEKNENKFEDGEAFEDSDNAKFLCEKNGFNADDLIPDTDGSIQLSSVVTYNTCYYLNYSVNDIGEAFSVCVSSDRFDSLEKLCESFAVSDGGFSLPVEATLNEQAQAVITVTEFDNEKETAVNKLTGQGFMYSIFGNESEEKLLEYADKIDF